MAIERLSAELEDKAFELILDGERLDDIAYAIGLKGKKAFARYRSLYPEFNQKLELAKSLECEAIEEEIRWVLDGLGPNEAKVKLEALTRILKWRDPKRYGDRQQIELNMTVDIAGALTRAEQRIIDVTSSNVIQLVANTDPVNIE